MDRTAVLQIVFIALLLAAVALTAIAVHRALARRRAVAEATRRTEEWKATNPTLSELSDAEISAVMEWYEAQALPAAALDIGDPADPSAHGSHIGGQVVWPVAKPWPQGRDGQPLQFLAQIDFATLPRLPDFPDKGVLQFFIGADDLFGADFDNLANGSAQVVWWPDGVIGGKKTSSPRAGEDCSPLSDRLRREARRLEAEATQIHPSEYTLPWLRHPDMVLNRENSQRIHDLIASRASRETECHRVGGHPEFTQNDFREDPRFEDFDRVLLQLWSGNAEGLMWGDMGQGNFMIRRDDLLAGDFSKVTFHWDCC